MRAAGRLALLVAALGLLEGGARLLPGEPPRIVPEYSPLFLRFIEDLRRPFFRVERRDGRRVAVAARRVYVSRGPGFEVPKPAGRLRVICVGESTVALPPFTEALAAFLRARLPGVDSEVINAGQGFLNPPHVLKVFREALDYEPDAVVLYMGHNFRFEAPEVTPAALAAARWAERSVLLRRGVGAARRALGHAPAASGEPAWLARFERVLSEMASLANARGVRLIVCAPASSLLVPPHFSPDQIADAGRRARLGSALLEREAGRFDRAAALVIPLAKEAGEVAFLHYLKGLAERRSGRVEQARRTLARARDLDTDRASEAVDAAVRRLSASGAAFQVADVNAEFAAAAPDGLPGLDLFTDHCHPRRGGYRLIGRAVARALERSGLLAGRWRPLSPSQEPQPPRETARERLSSLLDNALGATVDETFGGRPRVCEIPTYYFEAALRLDEAAALARLRDPALARALDRILTPTPLTQELRESTWAFGLVHAGAALRRLGRLEEARALWDAAAPKLEGPLASHLELQRALAARRQGRTDAQRAALSAARAAWPGIGGEPLFLALDGERL